MSKKLVRKAIEMIRGLAEEEDEYEDDEDEDDEEIDEEEEEDEEKEEDEDEEEKKEEEGDDRYTKFWNEFGKNIKLGVIEDSSNRSKLAKLLRFHSTYDTEGLVSLDEYISRMLVQQDTIFYIPGDSMEACLKNPILAKYKKKGYEVLILDDPIDEFTV